MNSSFKVKNPRDVEFTLTSTMTLDNWLKIKEALDNTEQNWYGPLGWLRDSIREMTTEAQKTFYTENPEEQDGST